jgi:hypothetical protein
MITEDQLHALFDDAASAFELPADGPARVLAAAGQDLRAVRRRRPFAVSHLRPQFILAAAGVVVLLLAAASLAITEGGGKPNPVTSAATRSPSTMVAGQALAGTDASGARAAAAPGAAPARVAAPPSPASLAKIVKTGSLEVEVARGRVGDATSRISTIVVGAGGFVTDSKTSEADGHPSGTITVRVPADRFEAVVEQLRRLGRVKQAQSSGADVTAEYTDNAARLHTLTTARDSLLQVLAKARNIGDLLAVQDRLNDMQTQIEQVQGRQQVLDNQVALSTIAVSLHEAGDTAKAASTGRSAWHRALHGFTSTWAAVLARSGAALAIVIALSALSALLYVAAVLGRRAYLRRRA